MPTMRKRNIIIGTIFTVIITILSVISLPKITTNLSKLELTLMDFRMGLQKKHPPNHTVRLPYRNRYNR